MTKPYGGGKPTFHEFLSPIGLICHLYHDKPQLKTTDQHGKIPDIDQKTGIQNAEFKVTMAWSKTREAELMGGPDTLGQLAHRVKAEGWPESQQANAFFALEPFFRDGDNPAHNTQGREYLRGRYYLNFKQKAAAVRDPMSGQVIYSGAPGLLGPHGPGDLLMPTDIYPGCTGRVSGIIFATEYMGRHFISTRLNNIQKYENGERIGGGARPSADSQFGALKEGIGGQFPNGAQGLGIQSNAFGSMNNAPANTGLGAQSPSNNQFGMGGQQPNRMI